MLKKEACPEKPAKYLPLEIHMRKGFLVLGKLSKGAIL
jgi:hypothetical protein